MGALNEMALLQPLGVTTVCSGLDRAAARYAIISDVLTTHLVPPMRIIYGCKARGPVGNGASKQNALNCWQRRPLIGADARTCS